jgi:signal transduction histidine kinase
MAEKRRTSVRGVRRREPTDALLRERVKELDCIYGIARVAARWNTPFEQDLQDIVELLPAGWQHPEAATARVTMDGREYLAPGFSPGAQRLEALVAVNGERRGVVEVSYREPMPPEDEGSFLREERRLVDAVAHLLGLLIERRDAAQARARIEEGLQQADRLATIGLLAAGVAHELNEPLSAILGFAQLLKRSHGLPQQDEQDVAKIVSGALYARDVVRKLLLFARRAPTTRTEIDLNTDVVEDVLSLFEDRCAKDGIELVRAFGEGLPRIAADAAQLKQVLVNLVVNALQAMPSGGTLTVRTIPGPGRVSFVVEDTGVGMTQDVLNKVFLPFFTTKGPGQGTGLGLAVVHGIVTAHEGSVRVDSRPGRGSRFEVELPMGGEHHDVATR